MTTPTTNYGWIKPDVGASNDAWGGLLNTDLDGIDSTVKTVSNVANAALPASTASATYVAKAGDTMTGALTIAPASGAAMETLTAPAGQPAYIFLQRPAGQQALVIGGTGTSTRWQAALGNATVESGSNAGSDFTINRFTDAGGFVDSPLVITRATGQATFAQQVNITSGTASLALSKSASGMACVIAAYTGPHPRWQMVMGDAAAESGGNGGSNFTLARYGDNDAYIDAPLSIARATGQATFNQPLNVNSSGAGGLIINGATSAALSLTPTNGIAQITLSATGVNYNNIIMQKGAATGANFIWGRTGASNRWYTVLGDGSNETGGSAGSNWALTGYKDDGTTAVPICSASRINGVMSFTNAIVNGSDARLKENIEPISDALGKVKQLRGVSFNRIGNDPRNRDLGFIAQEVAPVSPESVQASASMTVGDALGRSGSESREGDDSPMLALDYGGMVALMAEAIKTLAARVEALEAAANG